MRHWHHLTIALTALFSFGLQSALPLHAASSRLCLQKLAGTVATVFAESETVLPACCLSRMEASEPSKLSPVSCCRTHHQESRESCDDCGCCITNPHLPQSASTIIVTAPTLQLNMLSPVGREVADTSFETMHSDDIRPRDPPTQSLLCVWLD
ncbi:hypothetical protein Pla110_10300 [Polystyrenella longa]|uniref:Uncharacterized protein n=1 Tax=Polystyrenella longa TaxID=2528007 RepID=A0A518CJB4_9PLAN|nr:hypothetical protein [Polystyrenella longa]QDU79322.1 hypothetical protein Pla110_10300 [Polystyrenella longa]